MHKRARAMNERTIRYEHFGGIIGLREPPALVFVNRRFMKRLGYLDSPLWHGAPAHLSAPTEVHFSVTNVCPLGCRHCTADSGPAMAGELSTAEAKRAIDVLAGMKVFHMAFGGGELFTRPDAIELAEYALARGIVPNATTNGLYITPELAKACRIFGQINVSLDGIGQDYASIRGVDNFAAADRALRLLVAAGVSTGINCLVNRENYERLPQVAAYAHELGLREVLFLRLKPSGRAKAVYGRYRLTREQNRGLFPLLLRLAKEYKPLIQVDCSFTPMICYHRPAKKLLNLLGLAGCEGGNVLLGMRPDGAVNACSHFPEYIADIFDLPRLWQEHEQFRRFRERRPAAAACRRCRYGSICRGGCPLFYLFLTGDFARPDPECPLIVERGGIS